MIHRDDRDTFFCLGAVVVFVAAALGFMYVMECRKESALADLTGKYELPDELAGCRVYSLSPAGTGTTLYVVVRDGRPISTSWQYGSSKARRFASVATP